MASTGALITAVYLDKTVQLLVAPSTLVFDGKNYVDPFVAKTVVILGDNLLTSSPQVYPINPTPSPVFTYENELICTVISVSVTTTDQVDVISTPA